MIDAMEIRFADLNFITSLGEISISQIILVSTEKNPEYSEKNSFNFKRNSVVCVSVERRLT